MAKELRVVAAVLLLALCMSCGTMSGKVDKVCSPASWVTYPSGNASSRLKSLDSARFVVLADEARERAIEKLASAEFFEATLSDVQEVAFSIPQGHRLFVVRAVAFDVMGGSWLVRESEGLLDIEYGVLTGEVPTLICQPIAVSLKHPPKQVFAHASAAR